IDMFDCVLPTRNGRHGTVWLPGDKQINLRNAKFKNDLEPLPGDSTTAREGYSKAYLHHLVKANESLAGTLLSIYNLRYLQAICEEYQAA
ncbi:MAG: tRNA-guanine transglycosylase, partial [Candidatus Saccharimonadales bacterium]|nr:tRNA-guanine transglycosylase [Candidatus Saccharimonadales bacterium]